MRWLKSPNSGTNLVRKPSRSERTEREIQRRGKNPIFKGNTYDVVEQNPRHGLSTILCSSDAVSFSADETVKGLTVSKEFTGGKNYFVEIVVDRYGKLITKTFGRIQRVAERPMLSKKPRPLRLKTTSVSLNPIKV